MKIGWIDFSASERSKVLSIIDLLSEDGTLDELGIAPIRDGFANIFFPGTSTIQTRAKYFLIVPYALLEIERGKETNPKIVREWLNVMERKCGEVLLKNSDDGVIGRLVLKSGGWVKRPPVDLYWSGIRQYGIFASGNLSLSEYIRASCALKAQKSVIQKLGNRKDVVEENEQDDTDSGGLFSTQFWRLPEYDRKNWLERLRIELTPAEAAFLKTQIIKHCEGSILSFLLVNRRRDVLEMSGFEQMAIDMGPLFPEAIRKDIQLARAFSDFNYGARIRYNVILSCGKNGMANKEWEKFNADIHKLSSIDIDAIFQRLSINNYTLRRFLVDIQNCMQTGNIEGMDKKLIQRECQLKGPSRAKLMHPGEFGDDKWVGGKQLDYRFGSAVRHIKDIFDGEAENHVETIN